MTIALALVGCWLLVLVWYRIFGGVFDRSWARYQKWVARQEAEHDGL